MSFSIDDLVSSLSSNHIGQEAIDLATLQAQLAETLFCSSSSNSSSYSTYNTPVRQISLQTRGRSQHTQPCTTPTARTPSSSSTSFNHAWGVGMDTTTHSRGRANSVSSTYIDETEEDERMVEDLLIPLSAPISPSAGPDSHSRNGFHPSSSSGFQAATPHQVNTNTFSSYTTYPSEPMPSSPTMSLFTTTDPFYIAQLQAANSASQQQSQSVFAQNGRLTQNSPFALPTQYHQFHAQNQWPATTCAAAF